MEARRSLIKDFADKKNAEIASLNTIIMEKNNEITLLRLQILQLNTTQQLPPPYSGEKHKYKKNALRRFFHLPTQKKEVSSYT